MISSVLVRYVASILVLIASLPVGLHANCGGGLLMPPLFFDFVSSDGTLFYYEKILDIRLREGDQLPFYVNFDNTRKEVSPYLGLGWRLPLLESRVEEVSEGKVSVLAPSGSRFKFIKMKEVDGEDIYRGNSGWIATRRGDEFEMQASCGGGSFKFKEGRLRSINQELELKYNQEGRIDRIVDIKSGVEKLKFAYSGQGLKSITTFKGDSVQFAFGVPSVEGNLADQSDEMRLLLLQPRMVGLSFPKQDISRYYNLVVDGGTSSVLDVGSNFGADHRFVWNNVGGMLTADNNIKYSTEKLGADYRITQEQNGAISSWYRSEKLGIEEVIEPGSATRKQFFTSGKMKNLARKTETRTSDGKWIPDAAYNYDAAGRPIRVISEVENVVTTYRYENDQEIERTTERSTGKPLMEVTKGAKGQVLEIKNWTDRLHVKYEWSNKGQLLSRNVVEDTF